MNPDFRGVDEVAIPADMKKLAGWTDGKISEKQALDQERKLFDAFGDVMPSATVKRPAKAANETMLAKWNEFQKSKGRFEGSNDMSLLDEFVAKQPLLWKPQIIGSCVWSNTFRGIVARYMYETIILGQPQEWLGENEFGPENYAPYGPFSYGCARKRANMRGGDGLYCSPMAETLVLDGVLACNTPELVQLLERLGVARDADYPEPQNSRVYRAFGNWQYIEALKQHAAYQFVETPPVTSAEQLWDMLAPEQGKPVFVCSMEAVHKVGQHKDGFPIHARNPRDRWPHNMLWLGRFLASDGRRFFRHSNESWGVQHIYNRDFDEVDRQFRNYTCAALGETNAPLSKPPEF